MAYIKKTWIFWGSTEYEITWAGRYGAKGEKRQKKQKCTPEQIKRQNQWKKENHLRRLIKANFFPGDYWLTLKYKKGTRPPVLQVVRDMGNFIRRLRRKYAKSGGELKYVYRIEIGKRGGIHVHMVVNRSEGKDMLVRNEWNRVRQTAGIYFTHLDDDGDYRKLAEYLAKEPEGEMEGQMELFPDGERKRLKTYSASRNLVKPEPETKDFKRRTVRKLVENGPEAQDGYYIDRDTVRTGVNPVTGYSYCHYTEFLLPGNRRNTLYGRHYTDTGGGGG